MHFLFLTAKIKKFEKLLKLKEGSTDFDQTWNPNNEEWRKKEIGSDVDKYDDSSFLDDDLDPKSYDLDENSKVSKSWSSLGKLMLEKNDDEKESYGKGKPNLRIKRKAKKGETKFGYHLHLHEIVEGLYFHFSLSVCL